MILPLCKVDQDTSKLNRYNTHTHLFKQLDHGFARLSPALFEPVQYPLHAPMHRLVLMAELEAGVVYSKELYGLCIPSLSKVYSNKMEDTVVSAAVQGKAKPDRHRFSEV